MSLQHIFEEQLKKYEQVKVYIDQNLAAQENILKALTEANVQYASVRKSLTQTEQQWNTTIQGLVGSYEAYEDLMKKSQEGKELPVVFHYTVISTVGSAVRRQAPS